MRLLCQSVKHVQWHYLYAGPLAAVDPAKTACTPTDVLLYCYYGAMLEVGR